MPPDPDESVDQLVEHFFLVNHPDHYLTSQVCADTHIYTFIHFSNTIIILTATARGSDCQIYVHAQSPVHTAIGSSYI